jgi:NTE family protein
MATGRALVLGGGGLAGIAWHTGVLHGMADVGLDVTGADAIVGTSAGATVAAQISSGRPLETWFRNQVEPSFQNEEKRPGISVVELWETMLRLLEEFPDPIERRRRVCALALEADTVPEPTRRAVVAGRLVGCEWSDRKVAIVAVDAADGDRAVFDAGSGVELVDAVAASSAVPGIWPPVTIGDSRYVDGGVYSSCNADLAAGSERVLVLAPMADGEMPVQVELLTRDGRVEVLSPDADSLAAFGSNPLDPAVRSPAGRAGYSQGQRSAAAIADWWTA